MDKRSRSWVRTGKQDRAPIKFGKKFWHDFRMADVADFTATRVTIQWGSDVLRREIPCDINDLP